MSTDATRIHRWLTQADLDALIRAARREAAKDQREAIACACEAIDGPELGSFVRAVDLIPDDR